MTDGSCEVFDIVSLGNMGEAASHPIPNVRKAPAQKLRKEARQLGLSYLTGKCKPVPEKRFKMVPCNCHNECTKLNIEKRKDIFSKFWKSASWQVRSTFILQTVVLHRPKRSIGAHSRKKSSRVYTLNGLKVCKAVYLGTLCVSNTRVNYCLKKGNNGICSPDKRGKASPSNKTPAINIMKVKFFFDEYPKYVSHYTESNKQYLSPNLSTMKLYQEYLLKFPNNKVSFSVFLREFRKLNITIYKPKTDTCQTCDSIKQQLDKALDDDQRIKLIEERNVHHIKARLAREDLKLATENDDLNTLSFTFDMQKIQPIPHIQTSVVYYKRQLSIYNAGIHSLSDKQGHMMLWTENEGGKGCNEVCSSIYKFLCSINTDTIDKILTFSDTCGGQNRNKGILCFIMFACTKFNIKEWTHRYLEPGHSYLPNDRDFALIEKKKGKQDFFTLDDWIKIIEISNVKKPFKVVKMANSFVDIWSLTSKRWFKAFDDSGDRFNFLKLSWFQISEGSETFEYGTNDDISGTRRRYTYPLKNTEVMNEELETISSVRNISRPKYNDLLSLLQYIPEKHHGFFRNLSHD